MPKITLELEDEHLLVAIPAKLIKFGSKAFRQHTNSNITLKLLWCNLSDASRRVWQSAQYANEWKREETGNMKANVIAFPVPTATVPSIFRIEQLEEGNTSFPRPAGASSTSK